MIHNLKKLIVTKTEEDLEEQRRWMAKRIDEIGLSTIRRLVDDAVKVAKHAYAAYSEYHVGAAILTESGRVYVGVNTESCIYTDTGHAEGNAVRSAIIAGEAVDSARFVKAVAVYTPDAGTPCGLCRQTLLEHAVERNILIIIADPLGQIVEIHSLQSLLPFAFEL